MKRILSVFAAFGASVLMVAQTVDPVVMTINGTPVTRSEFEYSYNKNGNIEGAVEKKTVEEYADMFINYKLKVAAALAAKMDTASSFKREFMQYRDMQLTPRMVDEVYIDSVAHGIYKRTADRLGGKDLLRLAHILRVVPQNATPEQANEVAVKADSIYRELFKGSDFKEMAKQFSQDPGSAANGGELPWIGPGMTLKEFETAAYKLSVGETSRPVKSSVGYHIIKMLERKQLEPYEQLKTDIIASLKRQGIEEISAEEHIKKLIKNSNGRLTRQAIMDSLLNVAVKENPELEHLVQEYHDGLLLYEISKQEVWDPASKDEEGLSRTFQANKKKYAWEEPRFKGFVVHAKSKKVLKQASKLLKKYAEEDWRTAFKTQINKDSVVARVSGPYMVKKGDNAYVDHYVFKGKKAKADEKYPFSGVAGKKMSRPKSYKDVKSQVETDYQSELEKAWIEKLRKQFTFTVDKAVLETVNKH